jgi:DNA-binding transcriptional ArsR family regulator
MAEQETRILEDPSLAKIFTCPTRGAIIKEIALRPRSTSELARMLDISPPAVLYHLRILEKAGLVRVERVERVRNNFTEKFYVLTSPSFMVFGDGKRKKGPVPRKGAAPAEFRFIAKVEGVDDYLAGFGLRMKDGTAQQWEDGAMEMMGIISRHAMELGKELFAQLDKGFSEEQLERIQTVASTLAPMALARALDDPEMLRTLRALKASAEAI